jgi:hypothetical protein
MFDLNSWKGFTAAKKLWFWVAQRFSAAIRTLFSLAALAAEVTDSTFSATASAVPFRANKNAGFSPLGRLAVYPHSEIA